MIQTPKQKLVISLADTQALSCTTAVGEEFFPIRASTGVLQAVQKALRQYGDKRIVVMNRPRSGAGVVLDGDQCDVGIDAHTREILFCRPRFGWRLTRVVPDHDIRIIPECHTYNTPGTFVPGVFDRLIVGEYEKNKDSHVVTTDGVSYLFSPRYGYSWNVYANQGRVAVAKHLIYGEIRGSGEHTRQ